MGSQLNLSFRNRLSAVLRNYPQTLRLSHNVQTDATDDKVHVRCACAAVREFYFHLSWFEPFHAGRAGLQAPFYSGHCGMFLRKSGDHELTTARSR